MARKRRIIRKRLEMKKESRLSPETKSGIWAIASFSIAILTVLSFAGKSGRVGDLFTDSAQSLFGWGFFIIPIALILFGISFLKYYSRETHLPTFLGVAIFVLAILGAFFIFGNGIEFKERIGQGGYLGVILGYPLLNLFGFTSSLVILIAVVFISFLVAMNIPLYRLFFKERTEEIEEEEEDEFGEEGLVIKHGDKSLKTNRNGIWTKPIFQSKTLKAESKKAPAASDEEESEFTIKVGGRKWKLPPLDLLKADGDMPKAGDIAATAAVIKRTLGNFGIDVEMGEVNVGPTVTQYTLRPAVGVKLAKILSLHSDLALALASHPIRIEAPIPGKSLVGIEVPNRKAALVCLRSLLETEEYQKNPYFFPLILGRDVTGFPVVASLEKMPHLLITGATGSGKSVSINTIILSLLYKHSPDILKMILIDPKRVELSLYNGTPHLITPVIVDNKKSINALRWLVKEMERRYKVISGVGARDIFSYNTKQIARKDSLMPFIVLIIDELADLMAAYGREIEGSIVRLAQMARAVGIHLIVSTQRPSVEVVTGLIKANITNRIAFQVASQVDSRTILDMAGAEKLLGNGDMLFQAGDTSKPRRVQGAFVSEKEVKGVVKFLKDQEYETGEEIVETLEESLAEGLEGRPGGLDIEGGESFDEFDEPLYEQAKEVVIQAKKASASLLQRRLRVGYARAARLIDMLEERGVVSSADGAKPREVLIKSEDENGADEMAEKKFEVDDEEKEDNTLI